MSAICTKPGSKRNEPNGASRTESKEGANHPFDLPESREAFYQDYREAVREMRRGDRRRFDAYQNDPRIKPDLSNTTLPVRPGQEQTSQEQVTPAKALNAAQFSVISFMSSVREMVTVLGRFLT